MLLALALTPGPPSFLFFADGSLGACGIRRMAVLLFAQRGQPNSCTGRGVGGSSPPTLPDERLCLQRFEKSAASASACRMSSSQQPRANMHRMLINSR